MGKKHQHHVSGMASFFATRDARQAARQNNRKPKKPAIPFQARLPEQSSTSIMQRYTSYNNKKMWIGAFILVLMISMAYQNYPSQSIPEKQNDSKSSSVAPVLIPSGQQFSMNKQAGGFSQLAKVLLEFMQYFVLSMDASHLIKSVPVTLKACTEKTIGVSAGKKCMIDGEAFLLKQTQAKYRGEVISNTKLSAYNYAFLQQCMGLSVPEHRFVSEKGDVFFAVKMNPTFIPFSAIKNKATRQFARQTRQHDVSSRRTQRELVRDEFIARGGGERNISELAVAGTFIQDLVYNDDNWGVDERGLFIVDVDHSPSDLSEYFFEASRMAHSIEFDFSPRNIAQMSEIYSSMLAHVPPVIDSALDLSAEDYVTLVTGYREACDAALVELEAYPYDEPTEDANRILGQMFHLLRVEYNRYHSHQI